MTYLHDHETPPDGLHFDELFEANLRIGVNPVYGRKLLLAILRSRQVTYCDIHLADIIEGFSTCYVYEVEPEAERCESSTYALVRIHNDKEE